MTAKPIRLRDPEGTLIAAGCEWSEPNEWIMAGAVLCTLAGAAALIVGPGTLKTDIAGGIAILSAGGVLFRFAWIIGDGRFQTRSLIFELDGTMRMPQGVPDYFFRRLIEGHHGNIGTVEKIRDEDMQEGKPCAIHRVAIYGREGHIVRVTSPLHPDQAHMVAVQLNAALQAVRDELSWRARSRL